MRVLSFLIWSALPCGVAAHPHVFIDTGLAFIFDDSARLTHVRVTWAYDEFYSLFILEDYKIDQDSDGILTPSEEGRLAGFDMNWDPTFDGDLVVQSGASVVALSRPEAATATVKNGRIITTHLRKVIGAPVKAADLTARVFDESYYTAYEITLPVRIEGQDLCLIERTDADIDARLAEMQAMLLRVDADADLQEMDIPMVGAEFATEIRVLCPDT